MYEEEELSEDEVLDDVLGENPRARELRQMQAALEHRKSMFERELATLKDEKARLSLESKIAEVEKQIEVLKKEEAITQFVESSVRVTFNNRVEDEY